MDINKILKNLTTTLYNPFIKDGCMIMGEETYSIGVDVHHIMDVIAIYGTNTCDIYFNKNDAVLACAICYMILLDPYGFDEKLIIYLNQKKIPIFNNFKDGLDDLCARIEKSNNLSFKISIVFSDDQFVKYHKQVLTYLITMDKDDNYWFDKEYMRWKNIINK